MVKRIKGPEYRTWCAMLTRCYNPRSTKYPDYGARGITVCDRWRHSYDAFLEDVGHKPSPVHTLDRFPNKNGNYEPGNVRWATREEQARNTRRNRLITAFGKTQCMVLWSEESGIPLGTIYARLRAGWDPEDAVGRAVAQSGPGIWRRSRLPVSALAIFACLMALSGSAGAAQRPIYPNSMVPGGIASAAGWTAHRTDPVYRGSGLEGAAVRPAQLRKPIARYVSYQREDGAVRWTDHPLTIRARELVMVANGKIAVRGRCGNLLTSTPPPERLRTAFVPPDTPLPAVVSVDLPGWMAVQPPARSPLPQTPEKAAPRVAGPPSVISQPPDTGWPVPLIPGLPIGPSGPPLIIAGGGGGAVCPVCCGGSSIAEVGGAEAPEPATWMLAIAGVGFVSWRKYRWMK